MHTPSDPTRVLVVEDEGIIALHIQRRLERLGYAVVGTAADGETAVRLAEESAPHLVLMDIILQGPIDGIETAARIRTRLDLPVVFLTAHSDPATLDRAKTALAYGYLVKPFEERELKAAIETALYRHEAETTQRLYRRAIAASQSAVVVADAQAPDMPLIEVNPAFERITGYAAAEVLGRNCRFLQGPGTDPAAVAGIRAAIAGARDHAVTIRNHRKDGTPFWNHLVLSPVLDTAGRLTHVVGIQTDVTAAYEQQMRLQAQEAYLRAIVDNQPQCLKLVDRDGRILDINPAGIGLFGRRERADLIGRRMAEFVDPAFIAQYERTLAQVFAGEAVDHVYVLRRGPDDVRWLESRAVPLWSTDGATVERMLSVTRDVTRRRDAERALRLRDKAIESSLNAVAIAELDGTLSYVNGAFLQLWRLGDAADAIGRHAVDFWADPAEAGRVMACVIADGQHRATLTARRGDGGAFAVELLASVVRDEHGAPRALTASFVDITERIAAEEALRGFNAQLEERVARAIATERQVVEALRASRDELAAVNAELEQANRHKDQFLASMSHELRTPLTGILGMSEALRDGVAGALAPEQAEMLDAIDRSGRHLLALINDILDLFKIESGQGELEFQRCSLAEIVEASLQLVNGMAYRKDLEVTVAIEPPDLAIRADARALKQLLANLLGNAVKFTPAGGRIGLDARPGPDGSTIRLAVRDTGIGIAAEAHRRIFEPFVQVDSRLNRQFGGTGLGLALAQRIADLHGGSIEVDSAPGEGSCFTVTLPADLRTGDAATGGSADESAVAPLAPPQAAAAEPAAQLVLVADDNEMNLAVTARYLQHAGYRVVTARDGYEAIAAATAHLPDAIVMDIQMPRLDGLSAIRAIRSEGGPAARTVPILAVTALTMPGDRDRCLQAGADAYFSKPISLRQLAEAIEGKTARETS